MESNDELHDKLSVIAKIDLAPEDKSELWEKIQKKLNRSQRAHIEYRSKRLRRVAGSIGAAVAGVAIVVATLISLRTPMIGSRGIRPFHIAINPSSVTSTSLDTASFRNALQSYLERHSFDSNSSSTVVPAEENQVTMYPLPVINKISDLAVRWSQVVDERYGFAYVTYLANDKPGIANVLALKLGTGKWAIQRVASTPPSISDAEISKKFAIYPIEMNGTGFTNNGSDQTSYEFLSGLIVNPSITRIQIASNGTSVSVPIINGAFGYVQVGTHGNQVASATPKITAYDKQGDLVFHEP